MNALFRRWTKTKKQSVHILLLNLQHQSHSDSHRPTFKKARWYFKTSNWRKLSHNLSPGPKRPYHNNIGNIGERGFRILRLCRQWKISRYFGTGKNGKILWKMSKIDVADRTFRNVVIRRFDFETVEFFYLEKRKATAFLFRPELGRRERRVVVEIGVFDIGRREMKEIRKKVALFLA